MGTYDFVVVGAGIIGLATARELLLRHPQLAIAVVDKEEQSGRHQSGYNSGVLHAGVYYKPGSLKADLCVRGQRAMRRFADEHGIGYQDCGKLIIATEQSELGRLADLAERGRANGVQGLRMIGPEEMREIEPHAAGIRAIHVPSTGIIDFRQVVKALVADLGEQGVDFHFGRRVTGLERRNGTVLVRTDSAGAAADDIVGRRVISCAGLHSDRVARLDSDPDVAIVPFRGDYYTLTPEASHLCRGLIYPVPDPALPFLGVHFTRRVDGQVWAGPNAVLATAREGYRRSDLDLRDLVRTVRHRGFRPMLRSHWRTGAREVWRDLVKRSYLKDLQRYVPAVAAHHLRFGPSGVRAQAVAEDGSLVDDFKLAVTEDSLHVLNAPSPGATASLAIAERLVDEMDRAFSLTLTADRRSAPDRHH